MEMETAPDLPGIGALPSDADSLPDVEADSLPGVEADPLPWSDESDPEVVSLVVPVPREMRDGDDLPRDRKDDLPGTCCARNCIHRIETECAAELREWQTPKDKLSNDDVNDFIFKLLHVMRGVGEAPLRRFRFKLFGQYVCRTGFRDCIGIGNSKFNRLLSWLKEGHMQPPRDLRHSSATERSRARDECDAALQWAYDILAESINSSDVHPADHDVDASAPELKVKPDAADPMFLAQILERQLSYDDYILEGARTNPVVGFAQPGTQEEAGAVPMRGREHVPRRTYTKPGDYVKHGYTEGCKGCTWLQHHLGPRANHCEECRTRIEKAVIEDGGNERAKKAKERIDHWTAQKVADGDEERARTVDPRKAEPVTARSAPPVNADPGMGGPEQFEIGSPSKAGGAEAFDELDDGPTIVSEKRMRPPVRAPPIKRRSAVHIDEADTKSNHHGHCYR